MRVCAQDASKDCHYGLMLAGGFLEAAPKAAAVSAQAKTHLSRCFEIALSHLEAGERAGGLGRAILSTEQRVEVCHMTRSSGLPLHPAVGGRLEGANHASGSAGRRMGEERRKKVAVVVAAAGREAEEECARKEEACALVRSRKEAAGRQGAELGRCANDERKREYENEADQGSKVCAQCGRGGRENFSKKQWAAKAYARKCVACTSAHQSSEAGVASAAAGAAGERNLPAAGGGREGRPPLPAASACPASHAPPAVESASGAKRSAASADAGRREEEVEHNLSRLHGPIISQDVLAARFKGLDVCASLDAYVDEECPVCFSEWECSIRTHAVVLECKHAICLKCMADWCGKERDCPMCRAVLPDALVAQVREHAEVCS